MLLLMMMMMLLMLMVLLSSNVHFRFCQPISETPLYLLFLVSGADISLVADNETVVVDVVNLIVADVASCSVLFVCFSIINIQLKILIC